MKFYMIRSLHLSIRFSSNGHLQLPIFNRQANGQGVKIDLQGLQHLGNYEHQAQEYIQNLEGGYLNFKVWEIVFLPYIK
jgi:hypothetical protein